MSRVTRRNLVGGCGLTALGSLSVGSSLERDPTDILNLLFGASTVVIGLVQFLAGLRQVRQDGNAPAPSPAEPTASR